MHLSCRRSPLLQRAPKNKPGSIKVREADRLSAEGWYDEAEAAYIAARKRAELLGAGELPMAITLNRIGYQCHIAGRLREAERAYAAALTK